MPHLFDHVLPGFTPAYIRIEIITEADGTLTVAVYAGEGPGFVTRDQTERYESLTLYEAADVIGALVDGWAGT